MDVGSVVTKSNHDFPSNIDLSSYVGLIESFASSFEQQVSDPNEFDFSNEFFNSHDTEFVPMDSISLVDFFSPSEVDLTNYKASSLGPIESSSVDSALTFPFLEDSKVTSVSAKVTRIGSFLLMLLFLGDRLISWIHNYLWDSPYCLSCNCICICLARAYEPDASFHAFSSLYKTSYFFSLLLSLVSFHLCNLTPFTPRRPSPSVLILIAFLALCIGLFFALGTSFACL